MKLFTNKIRSKFSFFFAISHPEKTIASEIDLQTDLSSYFEILSMELLFAYLIEIFNFRLWFIMSIYAFERRIKGISSAPVLI